MGLTKIMADCYIQPIFCYTYTHHSLVLLQNYLHHNKSHRSPMQHFSDCRDFMKSKFPDVVVKNSK